MKTPPNAQALQSEVAKYKAQGHTRPVPSQPQVIEHETFVEPNTVPVNPMGRPSGESRFKFKVRCKGCQWEALAINDTQVEAYKQMHEVGHGH